MNSNIELKTIKFCEEDVRENLWDLGVDREFLDWTAKA